ncbi:MAG TPA: polyphosphate kinase 1 [Chitinophagaceae bacterium]|nr:polyphosphate kinase 1 [Chitinophagaceae bacterium]
MSTKENHSNLLRDISWLSFNARVLQEANDTTVPLSERLRFLGIFSNNLDEFFRVRVATLNRMVKFGKQTKRFLEEKPSEILKQIQSIVLDHQKDFERIYNAIQVELKKEKIVIVNEKKLSKLQKEFVENYFNEKVRTNIAPLMIESIPELPLLHDKSIYLACVMTSSTNSFMNSYSLIEVPTHSLPRFIILPTNKGEKNIILLEDIIRFCLPKLFTQFGFDTFEGYIIKVTRDAELDIDNDINTDLILSIEKGLKNRKKGRAVRLVFDKTIQKNLLSYLIKLLNLDVREHLVPGGRIHNFKDFMDFPQEVFQKRLTRNKPFVHPLLTQPVRILEVLNSRDVMLHFPYHSFDSIIDLLREAAIDPFVETIKITCYRLAKESKIVNALINAVRNGKKVTVVLELRARFDEEANIKWKGILEEEGVHVKVGLPDRKIHAKLCLISKRVSKTLKHYGFVSTGNLNETTAKFYGDHCLLTANKSIVSDISKVFDYISNPTNIQLLKSCKALVVSPLNTRTFFQEKIKNEIKQFHNKKKASIILKLNSLADNILIHEIYKAVAEGVDCKLIIRGICCAQTSNKKWSQPIQAISIVDEYLEHARILYFNNNGKDDIYISSADWMVRNIDYRIEATTPIYDAELKEELKTILNIQLSENEKARILDNKQLNNYVVKNEEEESIRSQVEIYNYLCQKKY